VIINEVFTDAQCCFCRWDSDKGVAWDRGDVQAGNGEEAGVAAERDADDAVEAAGGDAHARLPAAGADAAAPGLELPLMDGRDAPWRVRAWLHGWIMAKRTSKAFTFVVECSFFFLRRVVECSCSGSSQE
jgi:hypothetical protein